jgi:outer membrane lipoprotein LolB
MRPLAPLAGAALLLAGCVHTAAIDDGLGFAERQARLDAIPDWNLSGQLIVDTGERRDRVRVAWEQRGEELRLTVRGAVIGAGSIRVEGNANGLVIEGRGETRVLGDPEGELSAELGWPLPVMSLDNWLLGQPDAAFPERVDRGPAGAIASLTQRDWRVDYEEYQLAGDLLVPAAITLTHDRLTLRLAGIRWEPAIAEP